MGDSAGAPALAENDEEPFLDAAWTEAIEATELLRTVLSDLGLADGFPRLRGDVNVYGRPMVTLGRIEPEAARRLAAALSRAVPGRDGVPVFGAGGPGAGVSVPGQPTRIPGPVPIAAPAPRTTAMPAPVQVPAPMSAPMPAPRTYSGPGWTTATDDLQATALRLMRLYGGPTAPAMAADVGDANAPESWAPMLAACAVPGPVPVPVPVPVQVPAQGPVQVPVQVSLQGTVPLQGPVPVQVQVPAAATAALPPGRMPGPNGELPGLSSPRLPGRADLAALEGSRGGSHRLPA